MFIDFFRFQSWQRKEEKRVKELFYNNSLFQEVDLSLKRAYRFKNPYRMLKSSPYGETPLTTVQQMIEIFEIPKGSTFLDFGSGRGRIPFFLELIHGMKVVGVESFPPFVRIANEIAARYFLSTRTFCEDFTCWDQEADFVYLYGTCLSEETLKKIADTSWEKASWITVSVPLSDYSSRFQVEKKFLGAYPWGDTYIFLNRRRL